MAPTRTSRRTFLASAAVLLAGCASDAARAPLTTIGSTTTPTTVPPTTVRPTVPATTVPTTTVPATTVPAPALPSSGQWWLDGNFAPVTGELQRTDLAVTGRLPAALAGTWVRNGPNPTGDSPHWFIGNGMVHGLRIRDGRAEWYRRRLIDTPFVADPAAAGIPGGALTYSNVSSVFHAGRLLSLGEIGFPYELSVDDLSTIGAYDFGGRLATNMTAHPKIDPQTGEMFFFGYDFAEPYLTYLVADATGQLRQTVPIGIGAPAMVHDFAITEQSAVFLDLAVQFAADEPGLPYRFDRGHRCRIGVIDRAATTDTTRWFDIETCFVFHTINAHQTGSVITLDVIRYDELWTGHATDRFPLAAPYRYTVDLAAGTVTEGPLDDRPSEFPMVDRRLTGRVHTTGWALSVAGADFSSPTGSTLVQYGADGSTSTVASFAFPGADIGGEPLFVADPDRPEEGGGWLLMVVFRAETHTSDLVVFDAQVIADGPVATVHLPERVPYGFHASWSPLE
jgi:carotenoid cleavage dioxygenase